MLGVVTQMCRKSTHSSHPKENSYQHHKGFIVPTLETYVYSCAFSQLVPQAQRTAYPSVMDDLLAEVSEHYEKELRQGTVDMMVCKPEKDQEEEKPEAKTCCVKFYILPPFQ